MEIKEQGVINLMEGILLDNVNITEDDFEVRVNSHRNKVNWIRLVHNDSVNGRMKISIHGAGNWNTFMKLINELNWKILHILNSKIEDYPTDEEVMDNP